MRLLLPLVCGVMAATACVAPSRAEGDRFVVESVAVQPAVPDTDVVKPAAAAPLKEAVVLVATPGDEIDPRLARDRQKSDTLRGSVLMILLPNLCCR